MSLTVASCTLGLIALARGAAVLFIDLKSAHYVARHHSDGGPLLARALVLQETARGLHPCIALTVGALPFSFAVYHLVPSDTAIQLLL